MVGVFTDNNLNKKQKNDWTNTVNKQFIHTNHKMNTTSQVYFQTLLEVQNTKTNTKHILPNDSFCAREHLLKYNI